MTDRAELLRQLSIPAAEREAKSKPWPWLIGALLLIAIGYAAFRLYARAEALPLVRVVTASAAAQLSSEGALLEGSGYVIARRQATVSSKTTGKLLEVLIEEGMQVEQGQILARLEPVNVQAQLRLAQAQLNAARARISETSVSLAQAERELTRQRELMLRKLTSQQALDQAQSQVQSLRARAQSSEAEVSVANASLGIYQQEVEDLVVRAPFSGMIIAKAAQAGEIVSPISAGGGFTRTGIGTIVDMNSLEVDIDVNESNIQKVKPNMAAEILLNAYPDDKIQGRVIAIIPTADRTKATVKVRVGFVQADARALPDMGARVRFLSSAEASSQAPVKGVVLSADAVVEGRAYALDNGVLKARSVQIAETTQGSVRIETGISPGEQFAIPSPGLTLTDGLRVRTQ